MTTYNHFLTMSSYLWENLHSLPLSSLFIVVPCLQWLEPMQDPLVIASHIVLLCMLLRSETQVTALAIKLAYIQGFQFLKKKKKRIDKMPYIQVNLQLYTLVSEQWVIK